MKLQHVFYCENSHFLLGPKVSKTGKETGIPLAAHNEYKRFNVSPSREDVGNRGTPSVCLETGDGLRWRKKVDFDLEEELPSPQEGMQEQSNGQQATKMVTSSTDSPSNAKSKAIPSAPTTAHDPMTVLSTHGWVPSHIDKLMLLLMREKDEKLEMQAAFQRKSEKLAQLEGRQGQVSTYLKEKKEKVIRQDDEVKQLLSRLDEEIKEKDKVQQELEEKKQKITHLEDSNYQRDMELRQVKEDHQENLAQLKELEKCLETEKVTKEKKLSRATKRIQHLQQAVEKAQKEVDTTRNEQSRIENVLKWMQEDLEEEKHEEDTLLKCKLQEYRKLIKVYRYMLLFVILVLFCLVLSRIVPFSYLCTSISNITH